MLGSFPRAKRLQRTNLDNIFKHLMGSHAYNIQAQVAAIHAQQEKDRIMSKMSHDRVQFTLSMHNMSKGRTAHRRILKQAFGTSVDVYNLRTDLTIVCRPSQFARFLIYRNEEIKANQIAGCNTFADMNPLLYPASSAGDIIDVSKNPHCG